jgi:PilZ domain
MDAGLSPARQARAKHRHELRTLTYVTLDEANGGIVRNLSDRGIAVQTVAAVRPRQQLRVSFELNRPRVNHPQPKHPRLRVESRGEVMWATPSGQCGISFVDLSPRMTRQINEWIFGDLLEGIALHSERTGSLFAASSSALAVSEDDGLMISPSPLKVIELTLRADPLQADAHGLDADAATALVPLSELDWLSQPLSGHSLIWTINTLVALAALLLFVLVFLSVTREAPRWPLAMMGGAAMFVAALYWGFFQLFGGSSPGARLARLLGSDAEEDVEASDDRFR